MGLDSLELLVKIEDAFAIEIPDMEAEQIATVGDFYETILLKITPKRKGEFDKDRGCNSQKVFYLLRRALSQKLNISRSRIKPKAGLKTLFENQKIRKKWKEIESELGCYLPRLIKPKLVQKSIHVIGVLFILTLLVTFDFTPLAFISIMLLPFYYILAEKLFERYATVIQFDTIGELTKGILAINYQKFGLSDFSEDEIYLKLKGVISTSMGIPLSEIKYGSRIGRDLGID